TNVRRGADTLWVLGLRLWALGLGLGAAPGLTRTTSAVTRDQGDGEHGRAKARTLPIPQPAQRRRPNAQGPAQGRRPNAQGPAEPTFCLQRTKSETRMAAGGTS